jgi:hypothetical protein
MLLLLLTGSLFHLLFKDATTVLQIIPSGLEIDNKLLTINYSKDSFDTA